MFQQIMTAYDIFIRRWRSSNDASHRLSRFQRQAMIAVLALAFLVLTSACQSGTLAQNAPNLAPSPTINPTQSLNPSASSPMPTLAPHLPGFVPTPQPQNITPTVQPQNPTPTVQPQKPTPTPANSASGRNHVHSSTLFARVTFTTSSTYDQAVAALSAAGENLYPWNCDDPRTPTPPAVTQQRAAFASSHVLFISYPNLPGLDKLASDPQVLSIDPQAFSLCP